ncbi:MAG: hypothetical protein DI597_05385 [Pseudoxanthomonas spadix]|nr:MAG: hypothetical protein DI597_05385 [Pseudoxanthomonas spadix]
MQAAGAKPAAKVSSETAAAAFPHIAKDGQPKAGVATLPHIVKAGQPEAGIATLPHITSASESTGKKRPTFATKEEADAWAAAQRKTKKKSKR